MNRTNTISRSIVDRTFLILLEEVLYLIHGYGNGVGTTVSSIDGDVNLKSKNSLSLSSPFRMSSFSTKALGLCVLFVLP